jgi:hypothetical protein
MLSLFWLLPALAGAWTAIYCAINQNARAFGHAQSCFHHRVIFTTIYFILQKNALHLTKKNLFLLKIAYKKCSQCIRLLKT